eukprot:CAMPEP_0197577854 /NCGR_PEP_ID=MMETSP1326-20131121/2322_1 /TAXON_ID=1155430 /ORGANISM="Genus nov. species nov., Strain RCC2288" /LENGTH=76 /DNA_ID=CAMNT_0043140973 /DNA_START=133 /DNA_END=363 /DNA_ORIENTATION=+
MTFVIYVGGQRVNSDCITNSVAWGGAGAGAAQENSRKRKDGREEGGAEEEGAPLSCKRQASAFISSGLQQNYKLSQ